MIARDDSKIELVSQPLHQICDGLNRTSSAVAWQIPCGENKDCGPISHVQRFDLKYIGIVFEITLAVPMAVRVLSRNISPSLACDVCQAIPDFDVGLTPKAFIVTTLHGSTGFAPDFVSQGAIL